MTQIQRERIRPEVPWDCPQGDFVREFVEESPEKTPRRGGLHVEASSGCIVSQSIGMVSEL